jgi:hypothetical protein
MVINNSAYFNIGPLTAFPKTMIALEKDLIGQAMMIDKTLNDPEQIPVPS